jgi:hypothetical protein
MEAAPVHSGPSAWQWGSMNKRNERMVLFDIVSHTVHAAPHVVLGVAVYVALHLHPSLMLRQWNVAVLWQVLSFKFAIRRSQGQGGGGRGGGGAEALKGQRQEQRRMSSHRSSRESICLKVHSLFRTDLSCIAGAPFLKV